jgi:hypothetical protein
MTSRPSAAPAVRSSRHRLGISAFGALVTVASLVLVGALVVPDLAMSAQTANAAATTAIVGTVEKRVGEYYATNNSYPDKIDPAWFFDHKLPVNPMALNHKNPIHYDTTGDADKTHPEWKFITDQGAYWYNPANGKFRAYVTHHNTDDMTLALYNKVNDCKLQDIHATRDGSTNQHTHSVR